MKSKRWNVTKWFDQGATELCVGISIAHELLTVPCVLEASKIDIDWIEQNIIWKAQNIDEWEGGSYPGAVQYYGGTSLGAALRVVRDAGYITGWHVAESWSDFEKRMMTFRPAIVEFMATDSILYPDERGRIILEGDEIGGHCMLADEIDIRGERVWFQQSSGFYYGINGRVWMTFDDLKSAIANTGQAVFLEGRKTL